MPEIVERQIKNWQELVHEVEQLKKWEMKIAKSKARIEAISDRIDKEKHEYLK